MPRWNRIGRVGLCIALVASVAGCYSYPYNPYAPNGPGVPNTYTQPGPTFPQNGTYVQPGTSFVQPSGPAAYSTNPGATTNLPPSSNTGFEPVPATNGGNTGSGSDGLVPKPQDLNNNPNDPFGETSLNIPSNSGDVRDPFELAIVGIPGNRTIARTIR
ncbi:MAG: hypothetical protein KDA65_13615 [Planctomycetaceae bacterium]|nr:hypothetical protein [Planctomycetaceae bacterium]